MKRFRVAEDSMRPTLQPGDEIVATDTRSPSVGDLVVFPHPGRDDFWMVKRVADPPEPIGQEHLWVMSDNSNATRADSRTLGPIPIRSALAVVHRLDATTFNEGTDLLCNEDNALAEAIERFGRPEFWHRQPGFRCLVLLILEQQVSLESGAAMYRRLSETAEGVTASSIVRFGADRMRSIGVTRQKADYLYWLAHLVADGTLDIESLGSLSTDDARSRLMSIKGIGPWTADAYLLSVLLHPDAYPVGDRALQVGVGEVLGMTHTPDKGELELASEPWRPVRAVAARIVWHAYLKKRGRAEPTDPTLEHGPVDRA
ncbi:MAG: S26 family signal peptidase [Acidimicrobiia bacterium]